MSLTLPMVLANITTPLIGLVDTAVMGHLEGSHYLAGASIGALILTQIYWICGFLRMTTTGLSAQAKGKGDHEGKTALLLQSLFIGLVLGVILFLLQSPVLQAGIYFADAQQGLQGALKEYFSVRVFGAPAALMNLALIGWMIGQQMTRQVMFIQVIANLLNAALDIGFVYGLGWQVKGVASASVIAEYFILFSSLWVVKKHISITHFNWDWFGLKPLKTLFGLNGNMFIRNLFLQLCLAFLTFQGARFGPVTAATNAIIMQFFVLIALGLDAVAFAVEALVGEAKGANKPKDIKLATWRGLVWSGAFALLYCLVFFFAGHLIIGLLTDIPALKTGVSDYLLIVLLLPLIGHWCFLFDGVYIGLTQARIMRNSMFVSAIIVFFPVWWLFSSAGNLALWIAFLSFLAARSLTLGWHFTFVYLKSEAYAKAD